MGKSSQSTAQHNSVDPQPFPMGLRLEPWKLSRFGYLGFITAFLHGFPSLAHNPIVLHPHPQLKVPSFFLGVMCVAPLKLLASH